MSHFLLNEKRKREKASLLSLPLVLVKAVSSRLLNARLFCRCEVCLVSLMICHPDASIGNASLPLHPSCSSSSEDVQELAELIIVALALLWLYSFSPEPVAAVFHSPEISTGLFWGFLAVA